MIASTRALVLCEKTRDLRWITNSSFKEAGQGSNYDSHWKVISTQSSVSQQFKCLIKLRYPQNQGSVQLMAKSDLDTMRHYTTQTSIIRVFFLFFLIYQEHECIPRTRCTGIFYQPRTLDITMKLPILDLLETVTLAIFQSLMAQRSEGPKLYQFERFEGFSWLKRAKLSSRKL